MIDTYFNRAKIEKLALRFREGIETARENGKLKGSLLNYYPRGCCEIASELLAQYLRNFDIPCCLVYLDYYYDYDENKYSHVWLTVYNTYIVDITADQYKFSIGFKDCRADIVPCYVGTGNTFHDKFSIRRNGIEEFTGFDNYPIEHSSNLNYLFNIVCDCINSD